MSRKISLSLNSKSIQAAARELEQYKAWLNEKTQELAERLSIYGASVAAARFGSAYHDGPKDAAVSVERTDKGYKIVASGQDVFFIEFGAGVYFNGSEPYPGGRPPGVAGIGEYGLGHGKQEAWGFYDDSGDLVLTHGTPAAMPMWWATKEMERHMLEIAQEVFK